jgi:hypothetical protein
MELRAEALSRAVVDAVNSIMGLRKIRSEEEREKRDSGFCGACGFRYDATATESHAEYPQRPAVQ